MVFTCKICDKEFTTEGGLLLHGKVAHTEQAPKKVSEKPMKESKKVVKSSSTLTDTAEYLKEKAVKYTAMSKGWPKKATGVIDSEKVSKKKLTSLFPKETDIFFDGKLPAVPLHPKLESSYTATVKQMKNDWVAVTLMGKKTKVTWKEGPFPKKYRVTIPSINTK